MEKKKVTSGNVKLPSGTGKRTEGKIKVTGGNVKGNVKGSFNVIWVNEMGRGRRAK